MSITHNLRFQSSRTAEKVQELLISNNLGLQTSGPNLFITDSNGIYGGIYEISLDNQKYISSAFGIRANVEASFTEDSDGDIEESEKAMGKAVALILQQEKGDAIFFHVIDTPILKRVNEQISVVKESWSKWLTDALDEAGLEYKIQTIEEIGKVEV